MEAAAILIRYAKSRQAAYLKYGRLTSDKAEAITKIGRVADFFSRKSEQVQLRAVIQVEQELRLILPHEQSRTRKLRDTILRLIDQAKSLTHASTRIPVHEEPDGRPHSDTARDPGTQLRIAGW